MEIFCYHIWGLEGICLADKLDPPGGFACLIAIITIYWWKKALGWILSLAFHLSKFQGDGFCPNAQVGHRTPPIGIWRDYPELIHVTG